MTTEPERDPEVTNPDVLKTKAIASILENIDPDDPADAKQALALIRAMLEVPAKP